MFSKICVRANRVFRIYENVSINHKTFLFKMFNFKYEPDLNVSRLIRHGCDVETCF